MTRKCEPVVDFCFFISKKHIKYPINFANERSYDNIKTSFCQRYVKEKFFFPVVLAQDYFLFIKFGGQVEY